MPRWVILARMVRATFSYLNTPSTHFDFSYYVEQHIPRARGLLNPLRVEVDRCLSGEERGSLPRYICVVYLYFASLEDYLSALSAHGDELGRDVPNYTNAELEVLVSEVILG
jgi:uncharacterized protein (TIGR02118 family)